MNDWVAKTRAQYAHIPILSIAELSALPGPAEYDSGIYFLWAGDALIYIGKSRNLCNRLYHLLSVNRYAPFQAGRVKPIPFERITCLALETGIECSRNLDFNLQSYERAYIAAYEPPYNEDYVRNGFT